MCVEQRDGVAYDASARPLPVLRMSGEDAAIELPDLAESWGWVHVQSLGAAADIGTDVAAGSGAVLARLICPRRLLDGRSYRAALVPAFDVGVAAGLGADVTTFAQAAPAWRTGEEPPTLELPVYLTWTFTTAAEAGDFEELARRLEPDAGEARLGLHAARVVDDGLLPPFDGGTGFEYEGPLVDVGSVGSPLTRPARIWFDREMTRLLDESADRLTVPRAAPPDYDPQLDDPVLGPPLHGSWAADTYEVPGDGWLREVNLDPRRRSAAGLGAAVVRDHQDEFLAAAWDQAGDVRALQEELNRGRLAAEVGRSHARRLSLLGDPALLQATSRVHVFAPVFSGLGGLDPPPLGPVDPGGLPGDPTGPQGPGGPGRPGPGPGTGGIPTGPQTVAEKIRRSVIVPSGAVSPAFARQTSRAAVVTRRAGRQPGQPPVGIRSIDRFVTASRTIGTGDVRDVGLETLARFGATFVGANTVTVNTAFRLVEPGGAAAATIVVEEQVPAIASTPDDDITTAATAVRRSLDPMRSIVAGLDARIDGIALDHALALPTRIPVGPRFPDPLYPMLRRLGTDLVLPGVDSFGANRVRLLAVNEAWVAAFLTGANHQWAREALWNEYPADLGATSFSTFWPHVPTTDTDLSRDMHDWPLDEPLADQVGGIGTSTVLLVRGDLIRRHPDTELMLVAPDANGDLLDDTGELPPERTTWPDFVGHVDPQTLFVGFGVDPQQVWDEGWYVSIQEPVAGPRFGLDEAGTGQYGTRPTTWADASWAHVAASAAAFEDMTHIRLADTRWLTGLDIGGLVWGRNSAHLGGITFQQPFRLLLPASYLMPPPAAP